MGLDDKLEGDSEEVFVGTLGKSLVRQIVGLKLGSSDGKTLGLSDMGAVPGTGLHPVVPNIPTGTVFYKILLSIVDRPFESGISNT